MEEIIPILTNDDEEMMIFDLILNTKDRQYHYLVKKPGVFNLDELTDDYCFIHFRFYKADIRRLVAAFNIPEKIILKSGSTVKGEEALCCLLKRLAYPNRYADLMEFFPRGRSVLSEAFNYMIDFIIAQKGHVLSEVNAQWLSNNHIMKLCKDISAKGSPYQHCFGFVDGTVKGICRPTVEQREFYSGHKRIHSLKYQSLMLPNGIVFNLYGSVGGRRHDGYLLAKSDLLHLLSARFNGFADPPHVYGDLGYPLSKFLITPFKGNLTQSQRKVNMIMSS